MQYINDSMAHLKVNKPQNAATKLLDSVKFKSESEKEVAIEEVLLAAGIKKIGDIIQPLTYD